MDQRPSLDQDIRVHGFSRLSKGPDNLVLSTVTVSRCHRIEILPLKKQHTLTQRRDVLVTHGHIHTPSGSGGAVKGHKPPGDSCQSQEEGIIRPINNIPKGSGKP